MVDAQRHVRIASAAAGAGFYHSLALAEDGTVFLWGWNSRGQWGIGHAGEVVEAPKAIVTLGGFQVCALAAAGDSSCAVTAEGEQLFTWGRGDSGQLGHGHFDAQFVPKRAESLQDERVVAVRMFSYCPGHAIAVTRVGGVFGWGAVEYLGLPETAAVQNEGSEWCVLSPCRYPQLSCTRS